MAQRSANLYVVKTLEEVALFFDMSPRTIEKWIASGCPGQAGRFDLKKIARWVAALRMRKLDTPVQADTSAKDSPALEAKRQIEVELKQLDLEERRGNLISRESFGLALAEWSSIMRSAYEQLGRSYGPDAQDVLEQAVLDAEEAVRKRLGDDDSED